MVDQQQQLALPSSSSSSPIIAAAPINKCHSIPSHLSFGLCWATHRHPSFRINFPVAPVVCFHLIFLILLLFLANFLPCTAIGMIIEQQQQITGGFISACQFPELDDWLHCQRDQQHLSAEDMEDGGGGCGGTITNHQRIRVPLNGWFCDPESSISMSEVSALDESVRQLYADHGTDCVCPAPRRVLLPPHTAQIQTNGEQQQQQMAFPLPPEMPSAPLPFDEGEEGAEEEEKEEERLKRKRNGAAAKNGVGASGSGSTTVHQQQPHCWHRFGFAFVHELHPGPDVLRADQCQTGASATNPNGGDNGSNGDGLLKNQTAPNQRHAQQQGNSKFELPTDWESNPDHASFTLFANNFAQVLRERWHSLGRCGEDLLILVVQRPPVQQLSSGPLSAASARLYGQLPMLFVAPGPLVFRRLGPRLGTFLRDANTQLQRDARPLFRVLGHFLLQVGTALAEAQSAANGNGDNDEDDEEVEADDDDDAISEFGGANDAIGASGAATVFDTGNGGGGVPQRYTRRRHRQPRSHVPLWAWLVFAACGVAFGLMALGLFLIRTGTRRSSAAPSAQQQSGQIARRYWKEGEEQLPTQTYVNLVQMMMPHPKQPPVNMPQQV